MGPSINESDTAIYIYIYIFDNVGVNRF
jgi:hypothetical protein